MRVQPPHHLAHHASAFDVGAVGPQPQLGHLVEDPPLDGLETVPGIGQRALVRRAMASFCRDRATAGAWACARRAPHAIRRSGLACGHDHISWCFGAMVPAGGLHAAHMPPASAGRARGSRMPEVSFEHSDQARAALQAIVTDPQHGVAALSSSQTMANLLKDLLPDAPREKSILVAAAEAGLAGTLRDHVAQGMDPATAIRLAAASFSASTPYPPEACAWVASQLAAALGFAPSGTAWPGGASPTVPGGGQAQAPGAPGGGGWQAQAPGAPGGGGWQAQAPGPPSPAAAQAAGQAGGFWQAQTQAGGQQPGVPAQGGGPQLPLPGQPFAVLPGRMPRRTNNFAIASLACGLGQVIGWLLVLVPGFVAAVLALVFGIASLRQIRRRGEAGRGMAISGVVLGVLGILFGIIVVIGLAAVALKHRQPT